MPQVNLYQIRMELLGGVAFRGWLHQGLRELVAWAVNCGAATACRNGKAAGREVFIVVEVLTVATLRGRAAAAYCPH